MSVEGIWKTEMLGPYGWESVSTAFLENGRYLASSQYHYVLGSYEVNGNQIQVRATTYSHGEVRTMFGERNPKLELNFDGEINGDQINGKAEDKSSKYSITFRATRLGDLA
jgi:hypothetical protein